MNKEIKAIYDLLYSPIVTPYNLLENAKLQNYEYVKYYKGEHGLVAEMKCLMQSGDYAIFYYNFDEQDRLVSVHTDCSESREIVFDRECELKKVKSKILINHSKKAN